MKLNISEKNLNNLNTDVMMLHEYDYLYSCNMIIMWHCQIFREELTSIFGTCRKFSKKTYIQMLCKIGVYIM